MIDEGLIRVRGQWWDGVARSLLANTAVAAGGRLVGVVLGVVATVILTRQLGAASFGAYSVLLAYGAIIQLAGDFGLYLTLTRAVATAPEKEIDVVVQILSLRAALLLVLLGVGVAATVGVPSLRGLTGAFAVIAFGLACQSFSQLLMGIYQQHQLVWRATMGDLVGRIMQVVGLVGAGMLGASVLGMAVVFAGSGAVALGVHAALLPRRVSVPHIFLLVRRRLRLAPRRLASVWSYWRPVVVVSWPLGALLLLNAVYFRVDMLILSLARPPVEVGHYALAYRVIESALFFPAMFGGLLLPRFSEAWQGRQSAYARRLMSEGVQVLLAAAMLVLVVVGLSPTALVVWLGGGQFAAAAPLLRVLSLALAIMFFGNLFGFALVALRQQRSLLILYAALAVASTVGNLLVVPLWGAPAAAWATVATEAVAMLVAAYLVRRHIAWGLSAGVVGKVVAAGVMAAVWYVVLPDTLHVVVRVLSTVVLYAAAIGLLGVFRRGQLSLLLSPARGKSVVASLPPVSEAI